MMDLYETLTHDATEKMNVLGIALSSPKKGPQNCHFYSNLAQIKQGASGGHTLACPHRRVNIFSFSMFFLFPQNIHVYVKSL